uniref:Transmembrane protein n=1 Tax=Mycena chlorophos TaxID=658473 RepID=A0ABQ0LN80_MYCCL|nr:predicted protein [Mycena chlorophos]
MRVGGVKYCASALARAVKTIASDQQQELCPPNSLTKKGTGTAPKADQERRLISMRGGCVPRCRFISKDHDQVTPQMQSAPGASADGGRIRINTPRHDTAMTSPLRLALKSRRRPGPSSAAIFSSLPVMPSAQHTSPVVIIVLVVLCLCTARRQQRRFAANSGGGPGFGYFSGAPAGVNGAPPPLWKPRRWMPPTDQAGYNPGAPNADASGSVPPPYSPVGVGAKTETGSGGFVGAGAGGAQHYPPPPGPPPPAHVHNDSTSGGFVGGFRPNTSA